MAASDTYFLQVSAHVSLKVATKDYFRYQEKMKFNFLVCFSKAKTEVCHQKILNVFNQFGTFNYIFSGSRSARFIESSHQMSLLEVKNYENLDFYVVFLKQKGRSATKKIEVSLINLE